MGKLIYSMNVSLDGFIEAAEHSLDWSVVDEQVLSWWNDRTRESAGSMYGRRMYEVMSAYWPTGETDPSSTPAMREYARLWNALPKIVFSRSLDSVVDGCRLVRGDVGEELAKLREEVDGDIDVSGPNLASQFIERGLVDEFRPVVHPVILGGGTPFLPNLASRIRLRQTAMERLDSGVVALRYVVV